MNCIEADIVLYINNLQSSRLDKHNHVYDTSVK